MVLLVEYETRDDAAQHRNFTKVWRNDASSNQLKIPCQSVKVCPVYDKFLVLSAVFQTRTNTEATIDLTLTNNHPEDTLIPVIVAAPAVTGSFSNIAAGASETITVTITLDIADKDIDFYPFHAKVTAGPHTSNLIFVSMVKTIIE